MDYRNEIKYMVSEAQLALLENRIGHLISPDRHAGADGTYQIRSLYFDCLLYTSDAADEARTKTR